MKLGSCTLLSANCKQFIVGNKTDISTSLNAEVIRTDRL